MEENNLFKIVLITIWLTNLAIPIILIFMQGAFVFWTRNNFNVDLFKNFQNLKSKLIASDMEDDPWWVFFAIDLFSVGVICFISGVLHNCIGVNPLYVFGSITLVVFGPRFIIDMFKAVGMNNKTGNAERITALEEELDKLKGKK